MSDGVDNVPRTRSRTRVWLRRLAIAGAGLFLLCAVVVLALALALQTDWGRKKVRTTIVNTANETLRGTLAIGALKGNPLSEMQLEAVALRDPKGDVVLEVPEVRLRYSLSSAISGPINVSSLVLEQPSIHLVQGDDGEWNLAASLPTPTDEDGTLRLRIESLQIENGTVTVDRDGQRIVLSDVFAKLRIDIDGPKTQFEILEMSARGPRLPSKVYVAGAMTLDSSGIAGQNLSIQTGDSSLNVETLRWGETSSNRALSARLSVQPSLVSAFASESSLSMQAPLTADIKFGDSAKNASAKNAANQELTALFAIGKSTLNLRTQVTSDLTINTLSVQGTSLNPAILFPQSPSAALDLSLEATVAAWSTQLQELALDGNATLAGRIEGEALQGLSSTIAFADGVASLDVNASDIGLAAKVAYDVPLARFLPSSYHLDTNLEELPLSKLMSPAPRLLGHVKSSGTFQGPLSAIALASEGEFNQLQFETTRVEHGQWTANLVLTKGLPAITADIAIDRARLGQERIARAEVHLKNTGMDTIEATAFARGPRGRLTLAGTATRQHNGVHATLSKLTLARGKLRLTGGIESIHWNPAGALAVEGLWLNSSMAKARASARWTRSVAGLPSEAMVSLEAIDLAKVARNLAAFGVNTPMAGEGEVSLRLQGSRLRLQSELRSVSILQSPNVTRLRISVDAKRWKDISLELSAATEHAGEIDLQTALRLPAPWTRWDFAKLRPRHLRALHLRVKELSLDAWTKGLATNAKGTVSAELEASKGAQKLNITMKGSELLLPRFSKVQSSAALALSIDNDQAQLQASVDGNQSGSMALSADVAMPNGWQSNPAKLTLAAVNSAEVSLDNLDLGQWGASLHSFAGRVSAKASASPRDNHAAFEVHTKSLARGQLAIGAIDWKSRWSAGAMDKSLLQGKLTWRKTPAFAVDMQLGTSLASIAKNGAKHWRSWHVSGQVSIPKTSLSRLIRDTQTEAISANVVSGEIEANVAVSGSLGAPQITGTARAQDLTYLGEPMPSLVAEGRWNQSGTSFDAQLRHPNQDGLVQISGALPSASELSVRLQAKRFDLAFLNPLFLRARIPVASIEGKLEGLATVKGPTTALRWDGDLRLRNAQVALPQPLEALSELEGKLRISGTGTSPTLELTSEGRSGRGSFRIDAGADFENFSAKRARASVEFTDFPLRRQGLALRTTMQAEVDATRDEASQWKANVVVSNGDFYLPRLPDTQTLHPSGALEDVVFVTATTSPPPLLGRGSMVPEGMSIAVRTAGPLRVHGSDVDVRLNAKLDIEAGTTVAMQGSVTALEGGTVKIFERSYQVDRARVTLVNESDAPRLSVKVSRDFPQARAIVELSGTPDDLELVLRSEPAIYSREEVLSLIVNGVASGSGGNRDQAVLSAISGIISQGLTSKVRSPLGIDSVSVDTTEGGAVSSIAVGKWIGDAIFLAYHRNFASDAVENQDEARLEYWLSGTWIFEARAGDAGAASGDLLWIFRY